MPQPDTSPAFHGSIFVFCASLFKRHGTKAVLVGGYAMIAHKVQRLTFDIDFAITAGGCAAIEPDIRAAGYSVARRRDAFVQFRSGKSEMRDLDFIILDEDTLDRISANGMEVTIAGESFVVPSAMHLIAMKLHALANNEGRRMKDVPDIVQLMKLNAIDPSSDGIKELFLRYNASHLHEAVVQALGAGDG